MNLISTWTSNYIVDYNDGFVTVQLKDISENVYVLNPEKHAGLVAVNQNEILNPQWRLTKKNPGLTISFVILCSYIFYFIRNK